MTKVVLTALLRALFPTGLMKTRYVPGASGAPSIRPENRTRFMPCRPARRKLPCALAARRDLDDSESNERCPCQPEDELRAAMVAAARPEAPRPGVGRTRAAVRIGARAPARSRVGPGASRVGGRGARPAGTPFPSGRRQRSRLSRASFQIRRSRRSCPIRPSRRRSRRRCRRRHHRLPSRCRRHPSHRRYRRLRLQAGSADPGGPVDPEVRWIREVRWINRELIGRNRDRRQRIADRIGKRKRRCHAKN